MDFQRFVSCWCIFYPIDQFGFEILSFLHEFSNAFRIIYRYTSEAIDIACLASAFAYRIVRIGFKYGRNVDYRATAVLASLPCTAILSGCRVFLLSLPFALGRGLLSAHSKTPSVEPEMPHGLPQ